MVICPEHMYDSFLAGVSGVSDRLRNGESNIAGVICYEHYKMSIFVAFIIISSSTVTFDLMRKHRLVPWAKF